MPRRAGEDLLVELARCVGEQREQRLALQPRLPRDADDLAQGGEHVQVGHLRVDDLAAGKATGAAHDQHHPEPAVVKGCLGPGEGEPVVGGEEDEGVVAQAGLLERVEHGADALVERARAGLERRHVAAGLGRVG